MPKTEERREGLEKWIEQRIRKALENIPLPFEKKLAQLRERIEGIQKRCQLLSCRIERPVSPSNGAARSEKDPEASETMKPPV
ncbi:MAG: hypothetical protein AB1640_01185 [bacterium]